MIKKTCIYIFICMFLRLFLGEPCYIPSESMEPVLCTGDWVWLDKASYGALFPKRFADIPLLNVFTWIASLRKKDLRNNWALGRIKGWRKPQENDIVVFRSPNNRNMLLVKRIIHISKRDKGNYYYVMGDNHGNSVDSRSFGEISESLIVGRISRVLFSTRNMKRIFKKIE